MAKYEKHTKVTQVMDENGNIVSESTVERTKSLEKVGEPDYVKLYSSTWGSRFVNEIPAAYLPLFLVLASRMNYCMSNDFPYSQLVNTGKPYSDELMKILGWKHRDSLQKGLKALCSCYAIRPVSRGVYQVNPGFAAKGQWKKNPRILWSDLEGFQKYFDDEIQKIMETEDEKKKGKPGNGGAGPEDGKADAAGREAAPAGPADGGKAEVPERRVPESGGAGGTGTGSLPDSRGRQEEQQTVESAGTSGEVGTDDGDFTKVMGHFHN